MILLTQQKRNELIAELKERISSFNTLQSQSFTHSSIKKGLQDDILIHKIALERLTAEPIGTISEIREVFLSGGSVGNSEFRGSLATGLTAEDIIDWDVFAVSPVPEIKLPEKLSSYDMLPIAGEDAWNNCIDEIKRLNGLED